MSLTDEQLDEARAMKALRTGGWPYINGQYSPAFKLAVRAAGLAREGWTPVNPDLIEAREICAKNAEQGDCGEASKLYRQGVLDGAPGVAIALAALLRGRKLAGEGK